MAPPILLHFRDRTMQGEWFQLLRVDSGRVSLPRYHRHDYAEIFWLNQGRCAHLCNGRTEALQAGSLRLLRPEDAHQLRPWRGGEAFRFTNLAISPRAWRRLRDRYPLEWKRLYGQPGSRVGAELTSSELNEFDRMAGALASEANTAFHVERTVLTIWSHFLRGGQVPPAEGVPAWLAHALLEVQEPEVLSRGVAGLVAAAGRCHEHVSRMCRRYLGKTPTQLVNEARLRQAAHALRMSSGSVLDVCLACGFENPAQFHRLFRARFGTTPGRYRRS